MEGLAEVYDCRAWKCAYFGVEYLLAGRRGPHPVVSASTKLERVTFIAEHLTIQA